MPPENPIGKPFIVLSEVDSSNNYAIGQVQAQMAEHGATWFARFQKAGKGQRGRTWDARADENIMISSVVEPASLSIGNQFKLSLIAALGCYDFFSHHAGDQTRIKWPNDLYWRDRKAGGILIENILQGKNWKFSVIGVGININQTLFSANLLKPVSLKQITGKTFNVIELAKELCERLEARWQQAKSRPIQALTQEYCSVLYKVGEKVIFKKDNALFEATVTGVNERGELIINTGIQTSVQFGTVEWVA